jgi:hypothetical protein
MQSSNLTRELFIVHYRNWVNKRCSLLGYLKVYQIVLYGTDNNPSAEHSRESFEISVTEHYREQHRN